MISAEKCKDIVKMKFGLWSVNFSAMNPPKASIINVAYFSTIVRINIINFYNTNLGQLILRFTVY